MRANRMHTAMTTFWLTLPGRNCIARVTMTADAVSVVMYSKYLCVLFACIANASTDLTSCVLAADMSGTVVHLLEWPALALCSNPSHQTKGHHVPLGWCGHRGSGPAPGAALVACFWLFFLWL